MDRICLNCKRNIQLPDGQDHLSVSCPFCGSIIQPLGYNKSHNDNKEGVKQNNTIRGILICACVLFALCLIGIVVIFIKISSNNSNNMVGVATTEKAENEIVEDKDEIRDTSEVNMEVTTEKYTTELTETVIQDMDMEQDTNEDNPFYGVWCFGSKSESEAMSVSNDLISKGFNAKVIVTTDWSNLNAELFYVVTADTCETENEAYDLLDSVKNEGYSDAYVKFSGDRIQ